MSAVVLETGSSLEVGAASQEDACEVSRIHPEAVRKAEVAVPDERCMYHLAVVVGISESAVNLHHVTALIGRACAEPVPMPARRWPC